MARRALERNLHDGAQQRLVALSVSLRLARVADGRAIATRRSRLLAGAQAELAQALEELRELARGIHPAVLTDRGLRPALETLAARTPVPVELDRTRRAALGGRGGSRLLRRRGVADQRREVRTRHLRTRVRQDARRRAGRDRLRRRRRWGGSRERLRAPRARRSRGRSRRHALGREPAGPGHVDPGRDPSRRDAEIHSHHEQPADRNGHLPLRGRRGFDCAAAGSAASTTPQPWSLLRRLLREAVAAHGGCGDRRRRATSTSPRSRTDARRRRGVHGAARAAGCRLAEQYGGSRTDRPARRHPRSRRRGLHRRRRGARVAHRERRTRRADRHLGRDAA